MDGMIWNLKRRINYFAEDFRLEDALKLYSQMSFVIVSENWARLSHGTKQITFWKHKVLILISLINYSMI